MDRVAFVQAIRTAHARLFTAFSADYGHRYSFRMGLKPNAKVGTSAARSVLHRALHSLLQPTMRRIRDCQAAPFHGQRHPPLLGIGSAAGGSMTRF